MPNPEVQWTNKLPALIIGVLLALGGLFASSRRAFFTSLVLFALAFCFLAYSLTIKEWCALHGTEFGKSAWGTGGFGGGIGDCLEAKGWLSF